MQQGWADNPGYRLDLSNCGAGIGNTSTASSSQHGHHRPPLHHPQPNGTRQTGTMPPSAGQTHQWCGGPRGPPAVPCPAHRCRARAPALQASGTPKHKEETPSTSMKWLPPQRLLPIQPMLPMQRASKPGGRAHCHHSTHHMLQIQPHLLTISWLAGDTARMRQEGACKEGATCTLHAANDCCRCTGILRRHAAGQHPRNDASLGQNRTSSLP